MQSLVIATISLSSGLRVQEYPSLATNLLRAAEILIDRTDKRSTITDATLAVIGFCLNGILSLFTREDGRDPWADSWERYVHPHFV